MSSLSSSSKAANLFEILIWHNVLNARYEYIFHSHTSSPFTEHNTPYTTQAQITSKINWTILRTLTYICYKSVSFLADLQEDSTDHSIRSIRQSLYLNWPLSALHQYCKNNPRRSTIRLKIRRKHIINAIFARLEKNLHNITSNLQLWQYTYVLSTSAGQRLRDTNVESDYHGWLTRTNGTENAQNKLGAVTGSHKPKYCCL